MKQINFKKIMLALIVGMGVITSCEKDDDVKEKNQHNDAFSDVFIKKLQTPKGAMYGLVFYAGGEGLVSCKAKAPNNTEYDLAEYWKGKGNLRNHPAQKELKGVMPQSGDYVFTLTFDDGVTKDITDVLSNIEIAPMTGLEVTYDSDKEKVSATWNAIENVDGYMVKLTDEEKTLSKPIFVNKMPPSKTSYSFDKSTSGNPGWMRTGEPSKGDINYVFLVGVISEEGAEGSAKENNKQMVTAQPYKIASW